MFRHLLFKKWEKISYELKLGLTENIILIALKVIKSFTKLVRMYSNYEESTKINSLMQ